MNDFCRIIAGEIRANAGQVEAAVPLLRVDEGTPCRLSHVIVKKSPAVRMTRSRERKRCLGYLRELEDR